MNYMVVVEEGPHSFGAYVPDLPGCVAVGETRDEVTVLIKEAVELHVADLHARGESVPLPTSSSVTVEVQLASV